jgi:hypothetical protein
MPWRVTAVVAAGLLVMPAMAQADVPFNGRTGQGRAVKIVAEDTGAVKRAAIRWRADCRRPGFRFTESTTFRMPLDSTTARSFRDSGSYRLRLRRGFRAIVSPTISGRKAGPRRWIGRFHVRVVVRRAGQVRDRCAVRGVRWRARR